MFRKIVTEIAYSPASAGSLGHYIRRLRSESSRRQIGLIFVLLAITIQILAASFPPESANATNPSVFIDGGIQSIDDFLHHFDQNTGNVRDLFSSLDITRPEIEAASLSTLPTRQDISFWSMQNNRDPSNTAYSFQAANGKAAAVYHQTPTPSQANSPVYVGSSSGLEGGWFAITQDSANLITKTPAAPECTIPQPKSLRIDSWSDNTTCPPTLDFNLSMRAISSRSPSLHELRPSDRIAYTLSVRNTDTVSLSPELAINLEDVLEYARILDYGGGSYDYDTRNISWPAATIAPQSEIDRTVIVQLLPAIPSTAQGQYASASYDCVVSATFGNTLSSPVDCPFPKQVEQVANNLPRLSAKVNYIAATGLLMVTLFFYARSRQLLAELLTIRHNNLGGL